MTLEDKIKTLEGQIVLLAKAVNELQGNQCQHCDECYAELPFGMDETPEEREDREEREQRELVAEEAYYARKREAQREQLAVDRQKAKPLQDLAKRSLQVASATSKVNKPAGPGPGFNYPKETAQ